MLLNKSYYILFLILITFLSACNEASEKVESRNEYGLPNHPSYISPKLYNIYPLAKAPVIDGIILDDEWKDIPWSKTLVSEADNNIATADYSTKYKLARSSDSLYFAAVIFDQHIWSRHDICESYFFDDNFIELYIDADADEYDYVVLKINALGDFCGEYRNRDSIAPLLRFSLLDENTARCKVFVEGSINNPSDLDTYWSVECSIPFNFILDDKNILKPIEMWKANVQRIHWSSVIVSGIYKKLIDPETGIKYPGDKWVWNYMDENSIYTPEFWGEWHLLNLNKTNQAINQQEFERKVKWELRNIYYAQQLHYKKHNRYAHKIAGLKDTGLDLSSMMFKPKIQARNKSYSATILNSNTGLSYSINEKGKLSVQ